MLSKAQVKDIRGLATVKGRAAARAFVAEGDKIVREWLMSRTQILLLAATQYWLDSNRLLIDKAAITTITAASADELARASSLTTPPEVLIVAPLPEPSHQISVQEWTLALDDIQDPGNMGTLIRIADWFGIGHVVASPACADFYNPKVVQAAMGAHLRVKLHKHALAGFLSKVEMPVIAAALGGENVYGFNKQKSAVLVIGNESQGISEEILSLCDYQIAIPRRGGAESLNAGVSAGILCALLMEG